MNCNEYKEAIAADPTESFENGAEHAAACVSCTDYRDAMRAFDARIERALKIDVPPLAMPDLPDLEAENVVRMPRRQVRNFSLPAWAGIAASVVLAAFLLVQLLPVSDTEIGHQMLAAEVLEHLDHEPQALVVTNVSVSDDSLTSVVPPTIGTIDRDVGLVTYAKSCVINGKTVPHLVIQGEKGPVTVLLMPEEMVSGAVPLEGDSVRGVILPVGKGSIAIIGEREERLQEIEQRVVDSVEWSI